MNGIRVLRLSLLGVAAVAALLGALFLAGAASAQGGDAVGVSSGSAGAGDEGDVTVAATDIGEPGLGAWTLDITYDNSLISAVDCVPEQGGVCNPNFADDTVRITGASAGGLEGDSTLGTITFECGNDGGTSDLDLSTFTFADATIGGPLPIDDVTVSDGTFTCSAVAGVPDAGTGFTPDSNSMGWLLAVLAYFGLAGLAVGALRWRTQQ